MLGLSVIKVGMFMDGGVELPVVCLNGRKYVVHAHSFDDYMGLIDTLVADYFPFRGFDYVLRYINGSLEVFNLHQLIFRGQSISYFQEYGLLYLLRPYSHSDSVDFSFTPVESA